MKIFPKKRARLAAVTAAVGVSALLSGVAFAAYAGAEPAAVSLIPLGSTTVGPLTEQVAPIYQAEAANGGTNITIPVPWQGSGESWKGIKSTNPTILFPALGFWADFGQSSRPGTATDKLVGGVGQGHVYEFGKDALIFCVKNSAGMAFLSGQSLKISEIKTIYEDGAGAAVLDIMWSNINPAWPARPIVPFARILESGSQPDMLRLTSTVAASEAGTVADSGKPRQQESRDQADRCAEADDQLAYTGLAAVDDLGIAGQIIEIPIIDDLNLWPGDPGPTTPVAPTAANVFASTYPLTRQLYYQVHDTTLWPRNYDLLRAKPETVAAGMTDAQVRALEARLNKADDFINKIYTCGGTYTFPNTCVANSGGALIQASDLVANPLATEVLGGIPFPDWDVDLVMTDHDANPATPPRGSVNVLDVLPIRDNFGKSSAVKGWVRADTNNDGAVNVLDVLPIRDHFGQVGFIEPNVSN